MECCFCFGSVSSFFLELFLHWSPVAYWAHTNLGSSSFIVLSFCLFILSMGFSRQEYWSGLPFPSPVDHVLSELFTMTSPSWVALHSMAYSFIDLDKALVHVIRLVSFLWLWFSFCLSILFMGFSRQEYWSGLPFPSPVNHVLSELSTMTLPSWVALHNMAHSFFQLEKAVVLVIRLVIKPKGWEVMVFRRQCDLNYVVNQQLWWKWCQANSWTNL